MAIRSDVERFPGGDYTQLLKTKEALEATGIECRVALGPKLDPGGFDVVHLFNTLRVHETYLQFLRARDNGIPVVLSTIWHALGALRRFTARRLSLPWIPIVCYCALKEAYYAKRSGLDVFWPSVLAYRRLQRRVVEGSEAVLPNSHAELEFMRRELNAKPKRAFVVPNGVDVSECQKSTPISDRHQIFCVGRIEPIKNQIGVLKAFEALGRRDLRLVFYGAINSAHPSYWAKLEKKLIPGWIEYRGRLTHDELMRRYQECRTVVLASFFETTGLVVLEALANGANAVVLDNPYTREYFEGHAIYCNSYSQASIVDAIRKSLDCSPPDPSRLLERFTWQEAARVTLEAYNAALEGVPAPLPK